MSAQPVKIKQPDIITKGEFMKSLFRPNNSLVEFRNIDVKHDMTIGEKAKEK